MSLIPYDRTAAVDYAHKWAYRRNPAYLDFSSLGGDCTNFASQCLYAGAGVMNYTPTFGWFYKTASQRAPAWTGVQYFYNFLTRNLGDGPFAREVSIGQLEPGDLVQLAVGENLNYHHTPFVVRIDGDPTPDTVFIAAHSSDCDFRPLSTYAIRKLRCLHIEGVRKA
ncbi:MAG: amidase domain-containing protein [Clostridia bacterium]|nr:amidase domain-containing protein [Clostridia bacterium]